MSEENKGFFSKLKSNLGNVFMASQIDDDFYEELEEALIMGDVGVHTTQLILEDLKKQVHEQHIKTVDACKRLLKQSIMDQMSLPFDAYDFETEKSVVLVIGVNGVGKTTSIGKMAHMLKNQGRKVIIGACDTFRAAAGEQLQTWAERAGVDMISGAEGSDPSAVLYDSLQACKARNCDTLLCDTAGRLHNKKNLMDELGKMNRIVDREMPDARRENLLVLDATTGQNALQQAKEFGEICDLTGIILTKMDGTAKGGIAVAIQAECKIPVKYIGVGEGIENFTFFDAEKYVEALFE